MTTTALRVQAEAPALGLDARLALALLSMDERLNVAAVAFEVNTAHIEATVVDFAPVVPLTPTMAPVPAPVRSPIAGCLRRAHARILRGGWTTGTRRDEQGAACLYGAIRTEAHSPGQAAEATAVLLDTIRRAFPDAPTVPAWNDAQSGAGPVLRMLGQAANDAADSGI